jgi:hypothetical protein
MSSDKIRRRQTTETGVMPRIRTEPALHREPPTPPIPEVVDDSSSEKTGEMPIVKATDENNTRDEDTPKGSQ